MKINEVDPRNFDSDIDYYNALNAKPKARTPSEPRLSPAQQDAEDEDAISQKRQSAHKAFTQKRAVKYVDQEGSAPNGEKYNKLYVIQAQDAGIAAHEEYMFDKHEWGAKKVVDVKKENNEDGSVTHTLFIVDNHKYGMWKPWKDAPAEESVEEGLSWGWDSGDDSSWAHIYKTSYPEKIKAIAQGGGVGQQRTNNDFTGAQRILLKYKQEQGQKWSPDLDDEVRAQVQADVAKAQGVTEGGFKNKFAEFSGYGNYMRSRAPNVFKHFGLQVIDKEYTEDEDIQTYTVQGDRDSIDQARAHLERSDQFGGVIYKQGVTEATDNPTDVICVDVPLFIRLMEYAREDASSDMDLHDVAERLTKLSASGETVSMSSYDDIVGAPTEIKEADMDLEQGRKNILSILKAAEQGQDAQIMVGGEPITLEYPEARFVGGRYKSFMKAGRQEEFLRALTDARAFDRIMTKMRAVLDKQKNFRGSVPGERGVEEAAPTMAKLAGGLGLGALAAAGAPALVGVLGPLLGIPFAAYGAYSAAKLGMKGVEQLWDMATDKLGSSEKVEQYANAQIAKLPPEKAQAASAVIKQVAESRKSTAPKLEEGIVDTIKAGAKKAFDKLGGGSDEELLQRLEKETGGKRPEKKDNEKVKESAPPGFDQNLEKKLLKQYKDNPERAYATMWTIHNKQKNESFDNALVSASAKLKENEYFCMMDKQVKLIPEGYKRNVQGFLVRK